VLGASGLAVVGVLPLVADHIAHQASQPLPDGKQRSPSQMVAKYRRAARLMPLESTYPIAAGKVARTAGGTAASFDAKGVWMTEAEREFQTGLRLVPNAVPLLSTIASSYSDWARVDPSHYPAAEAWWRKTIAADPTDWEAHAGYARMLAGVAALGQPTARADQIRELQVVAHMRSGDAGSWLELAGAYRGAGNGEGQRQALGQAERLDPTNDAIKVLLSTATRALGPDRVRILVEDTGPGIPAEVLPKIFDPFVTTKGSAGTGLGLSISYGIIREHGGQITADSRPGRGAIFTIDLPVGTAANGALSEAGGEPVRLGGKRILIVEHDQAVQKILLEHLEPTGCTALTVARADEARQHLRDGIDLVVADFHLDGVDWLELLRQVAARGTAVGHRFIFITAGPVGEEADKALRDAGAALLYKPFTGDQFLDAVRATVS